MLDCLHKMDKAFKIGEKIIVESRKSEGHCRTPSYIRGKKGIIERICGKFPNPEQIAKCHKDPEVITLYRCQFYLTDVFDNYKGKNTDTIELEIYEHWLLGVK